MKTGKLLSRNYILNYLNSAKRFCKYLSECYLIEIGCHVMVHGSRLTERSFLSKQDIESLYSCCQNDLEGILNRAILSTYYGLGLRRSEGVALNIGDLNDNEAVVYVRQGKFNKDRYVPMSHSVYHDINKYINGVRKLYLKKTEKTKEQALFISLRGNRITGSGVYERLQKMAKAAGLCIPLSLHSLRHSIATHLLEAGMELEQIRGFLGHKSVESTQIYAHLNHKNH
jgi:integrase/recombinase XerD